MILLKKIGKKSDSISEILEDFFFPPISLKIGSVVVQDELMCAIFDFSDFAKKMWKKIRFKFENQEKV